MHSDILKQAYNENKQTFYLLPGTSFLSSISIHAGLKLKLKQTQDTSTSKPIVPNQKLKIIRNPKTNLLEN